MSAATSKNSNDKTSEPKTQKDQSAAMVLFAIAADTTWRMFAPTLGGMAIGLWLESQSIVSNPWGALGGLAVGLIGTVILVKRQYQKANQ